MTKKIIASMLLILSAAAIWAEPIQPFITPDTEKELNRGISIKVPKSAAVYPLYNSAVVINIGTDNDDPRNFGKYVETYTELSYEVKGEQITDLIFMIYSNLESINVKQGDVINGRTLIGKAFGDGTPIYPDSNDLYIYLFTLEMSPYLLKMTNGAFINTEEAFWWDPSFLIKQRN